jgi:glycosyltransferase involved in cell wall biosynthesis
MTGRRSGCGRRRSERNAGAPAGCLVDRRGQQADQSIPDARAPGSPGAPVRVLYLIGTLEVGGTERQLVALATRVDRARFVPVVCCLEQRGPLAGELEAAGVPVHEVPFRGLTVTRNPGAVLRRFRGLVRLMRRVRPTIVHTVLPHANALGVLAARLAGVPRAVIGFRGLDPPIPFWGMLAGRLADAALANAAAVREAAVRRQKHLASKMAVVRNGLDLERFDREARRRYEGDQDGAYVLTVANPNRFKVAGLLMLVEAAQRVLAECGAIRFLLVGDGPERSRVLEHAAARGLGDRFACTGTREDVPAIVAGSELVVLPSLAEGLPNVILEAMAAGKAVVATRTGGVPELVDEPATGVLVPPGDPDALAAAILGLLRDPGRRKAMGTAGRARAVREFPVERMVRETEAFYAGVLARGRL